MRAGMLRHQITIQSKSEARSAHGENADTWSEHATVWADVAPKAAKEGYEADQNVARITHEITIRALSTVTANMRVLFDSRYFYLTGPPRNHREIGRYMILDCEERE